MTQNEKILQYMMEVGGISSIDAFKKFAITRLSARIKDLRDKGYQIDSVWEKSKKGARYVRYYLRKKAKK